VLMFSVRPSIETWRSVADVMPIITKLHFVSHPLAFMLVVQPGMPPSPAPASIGNVTVLSPGAEQLGPPSAMSQCTLYVPSAGMQFAPPLLDPPLELLLEPPLLLELLLPELLLLEFVPLELTPLELPLLLDPLLPLLDPDDDPLPLLFEQATIDVPPVATSTPPMTSSAPRPILDALMSTPPAVRAYQTSDSRVLPPPIVRVTVAFVVGARKTTDVRRSKRETIPSAKETVRQFTVILEEIRGQNKGFGEGLQLLREQMEAGFEQVDQEIGLLKDAVLENRRDLKELKAQGQGHGRQLEELRVEVRELAA
jgi:hypothetical protein